MHAFLERGVDDLGRGQADALVDDLHSRIPCLDGDLLGAVRMAVEPRLADQNLEAPAQPRRQGVDAVAHGGQLIAGCHADLPADAGRRAVFAEDAAQNLAPFARGHTGMSRGDRGFHDVAAFPGGGFQVRQRRLGLGVVAPVAPRGQPGDLFGLGRRVDGEEPAVRRVGQRRRRAVLVLVDADDDLIARFDGR